MNPSPLPDRDLRSTEDAYNQSQRGAYSRVGYAVIGALAVTGLVGASAEIGIGVHVFSEFFAPDVGEASLGSVLLAAPSTVLAAAAFHLYLAKHPDALAGRLLNKAVPYLALAFVGSMALMAASTVFKAAGVSISGAEVLPPDLFADEVTAPETPLFERVSTVAFGLGLAGLATLNFWLLQRVMNELWKRIKPMLERRAVARETKSLMEAITADEALLSKLGAEKQMLLRELQPQASMAFATELAALVQKLRGPVIGVITGGQIWKKRSDSVLDRKDQPEIELAKFRELAGASDLTPEKIYAAFDNSQEVKKK
jgi:hypothetical protein